MAYDQRSRYQQPQQAYDQRNLRQDQGYDQSYDSYNYDQQNYGTNEYGGYDQAPRPQQSMPRYYGNRAQGQQQEYQDDYGYANAPPPQRAPPSRGYNNGYYPESTQQSNDAYGSGQRSRGPPPNSQRSGSSSSQGNAYPPQQGYHNGGGPQNMRYDGQSNNNYGQRQGGRPPPPQNQGRQRSLPNESYALPQDNAFPTFPGKRDGRKDSGALPMEDMKNMKIRDARPSDDQYRPTTAPGGATRSAQGFGRQGSASNEQQGQQGRFYDDHRRPSQENQGYQQHYEGHDNNQYQNPNPHFQQGYDGAGGQQAYSGGMPRQAYPGNASGPRSASARPQQPPGFLPPVNPLSPLTESFRPPVQRSMTVPQEMMNRPFPKQEQQGEGNWPPPSGPPPLGPLPPGPSTNFSAPLSPTKPPPRAQTAVSSMRHNQERQGLSRQATAPIQQRPHNDMGNQPQAPTHRKDDSLGDLYNAYWDPGSNRSSGNQSMTQREAEIEADMPNFDLAPPQDNSTWKRRSSMHLDGGAASAQQNLDSGNGNAQAPQAGDQRQNFYQQAHRSRSQPDLRAQRDAQRGQANGLGYGAAGATPAMPPMNHQMGPPAGQYGPDPRNRTPGPNVGYRGPPPGQGGPGPRGPPSRGYPPGGQPPRPSQTPVNRMMSPQGQRSVTSPVSQRRPSGGQPLRSPVQESNPDALPYHAVYERETPAPQDNSGMAPRPVPVRQYPQEGGPPPNQDPTQRRKSEKRRSLPVTHQEIDSLRMKVKSNPADSATTLRLAKKLVEAASVLADEGGRADQKTKNKNREKYIMEAHKIVKRLSSNGYPDAMFYLADCHGQGLLGLAVDHKEAFTLYQAAAKAGHGQAAYRTAVCCEMGADDGGGTKKDPLKAVQWYRRAASLGDAAAMYKLGMILLKGLLGQQPNLGEAINWLKRAADAADENNPHALHELALLYEGQSNDKVIRDEAYSFSLLRQAAELGYRFSQFRLGQAYEYGNLSCPIDPRNSIAWYSKAAAQGEHQSELALSGWYLTGSQGILDQSDTEAYLWARKAACAEPPLPKAMFAMGYFTEVGIGCPRSLEEAKKWYGRAAGYKFPKAQERLEELRRGGQKVQKQRERLSRTDKKQQDENCRVM